jgi:hypothetical protein
MHTFDGDIPKRALITALLGLPLCMVRVQFLGRTFLTFFLHVVDDNECGRGSARDVKSAEDSAAEIAHGRLRVQWGYL